MWFKPRLDLYKSFCEINTHVGHLVRCHVNESLEKVLQEELSRKLPCRNATQVEKTLAHSEGTCLRQLSQDLFRQLHPPLVVMLVDQDLYDAFGNCQSERVVAILNQIKQNGHKNVVHLRNVKAMNMLRKILKKLSMITPQPNDAVDRRVVEDQFLKQLRIDLFRSKFG